MSKTLFSNNVTTIKSVFSGVCNQTNNLAILVKSQPFTELDNFMSQLSMGDFQHLIDNFDLETFNKLAIQMNSLKTSMNPMYVRLLNYMNACLTTLLIVEGSSKEQVIIKNDIVKLRADNEVLYNVELLKKYLETLTKKTFTIFPDQKVATSRIKLRPEYDLYIDRYGFPNKGAFNPALLADIIIELSGKTGRSVF